jgi:chorismate lyase / 3-hydroxybenzoate synthase
MTLPPWIARYTGLQIPDHHASSERDISFQTTQSTGCALISVRVPNARSLATEDFREAVQSAYALLFEKLSSLTAKHAVRFWNFLPRIHQDMGCGRDRYMIFNAGRFTAFETRYGGKTAFDHQIATASAIGHDHPDLLIHCLSSENPGEHLGNPRQIAPYRYSAKFGPLPPCFARATMSAFAENKPLLLVGGTASIKGEESHHAGDLSAQVQETLENLSSLIQAAAPGQTHPLESFRELRVYHPRTEDLEELQQQVRVSFPNVPEPQILRADLCRAELLVEIEGVAELSIRA